MVTAPEIADVSQAVGQLNVPAGHSVWILQNADEDEYIDVRLYEGPIIRHTTMLAKQFINSRHVDDIATYVGFRWAEKLNVSSNTILKGA